MNLQKTLDFLAALSKNNDRDWFKANKEFYEEARTHFFEFLTAVLRNLSENLNPDFGLIEAKDCVFRIHRDVRFSKNKLPYKQHFGAVLHPKGRHTVEPLFYFHIEPNNSFAGVGVWEPPSHYLKKIREEIDYNADELEAIFADPTFKSYFSKFSELENGILKTVPRGYDKAHPYAEWLRLKHFLVEVNFTDQQVVVEDFAEQLTDVFLAGQPLNDWLQVVWEETHPHQDTH